MLQTCQHRAAVFGQLEHIVFDVHNAGHGLSGVSKKLQAHRAGVRRHAMQNPARTGDQAVAAFLLNTGQAT